MVRISFFLHKNYIWKQQAAAETICNKNNRITFHF